ncbi:MAG: hypothetical protein ACRCTR_09315 [Actinomycetota bacterium]
MDDLSLLLWVTRAFMPVTLLCVVGVFVLMWFILVVPVVIELRRAITTGASPRYVPQIVCVPAASEFCERYRLRKVSPITKR